MYADSIINNSLISANGVMCRSVGYASGGSSGAGSINIFYNSEYTSGENASVVANGGSGGNGGKGGNGSISIGSISSGTYTANN
jgi:hypothetical protein